MLREASRADLAKTRAFIEEHYPSFSREGLRYAIEKMPTSIRNQYLEKNNKGKPDIIVSPKCKILPT